MKIGVVTFPGASDARATARAIRLAGGEPVSVWHAEGELPAVDALVLPGGASCGDAHRPGALAASSPVIEAIVAAAGTGLPVLGIGNGFQVLTECGLLPGTLMENASGLRTAVTTTVTVGTTETPWTRNLAGGQELRLELRCSFGRFIADEATMAALVDRGRVVLSFRSEDRADGDAAANPTGSSLEIAGITDERGTVVGILPHPELPAGAGTVPGADGLGFFTSVLGIDAPADDQEVAR